MEIGNDEDDQLIEELHQSKNKKSFSKIINQKSLSQEELDEFFMFD